MNQTSPGKPEFIDNFPLIEITKKFISDRECLFNFFNYDNGTEAIRLGFRSIHSTEKKAYIVTAEDAVLELGSPHHTSLCTLLWTACRGIVTEGVRVTGRSFTEIEEPVTDFLLTVMVEVPYDFEPGSSRFRSILNLSNRIPGYMSRSIPGKLWIRISRELLNTGFSPLSLGQSVIYAFHDAAPEVSAVEVMIAAGEKTMTADFEPVYNLERIYSGKNRKLTLESSGLIGCDDLACSTCNEKKACDIIREIAVIKKTDKRRDNEYY